MKTALLFLTLLVSSLKADAIAGPSPLVQLVKDQNTFTFAAYQALAKEDNLLFSPYSIFSCLSIAYAGARTDTAYQMQKALQVNFSPAKLPPLATQLSKLLGSNLEWPTGYSLHVANGLWVAPDVFLLSDFRHTIEDDYGAKLQAIDFAKSPLAISLINEWVFNETRGKINALLQEGDIDATTRIVLASALYFKGNWRFPFDANESQMLPFHSTSEICVDAPLMKKSLSSLYTETEDLQVLALPLIPPKKSSSQIACLFLLPKTAELLNALEESLSQEQLKKWLSDLRITPVEVYLPKYIVEDRLDLYDTLSSLGMGKAFTPQADFSGIDGMRDLYLSKVVHKTFFALDEAGVIAAAATATGMATTSVAPQPEILFRADHPFLFLLLDLNTQTILMIGKLVHP